MEEQTQQSQTERQPRERAVVIAEDTETAVMESLEELRIA